MITTEDKRSWLQVQLQELIEAAYSDLRDEIVEKEAILENIEAYGLYEKEYRVIRSILTNTVGGRTSTNESLAEELTLRFLQGE